MPRGFQTRLNPTSKSANGWRPGQMNHVLFHMKRGSPRIAVSFAEADFMALQRIAERAGVPVSEVIRIAVRSFMGHEERVKRLPENL